MSGGYVKLHRSLWDSADFPDDPFSKREAFLWLVAEAAWKPREARIGNHVVNLDRGDCAFSFRFLASAWNWSLQNVRTFIKNAEARKIITLKSNTHGTVITICNYDKFQADIGEPNTRLTHAQHTPNTNEKKGKKERREYNPPTPQRGDVDEAVEVYNGEASKLGLPVAKSITTDRRRKIKARLDEHGIDGWREAVGKLQESPHCLGENDRGWRADLDFVCQPKSFNRLIEGGYSRKSRGDPAWAGFQDVS